VSEKKSATAARQYLKPFEPVPCFSTHPLSLEKSKECTVQIMRALWIGKQHRMIIQMQQQVYKDMA
jgi:hypothetical protein